MFDHYLIWSHEHGQWWAPDRQGYTDEVSRAGRYSFQEAATIVVPAYPPGIEVAVAEMVAQLQESAFGLLDRMIAVGAGPTTETP